MSLRSLCNPKAPLSPILFNRYLGWASSCSYFSLAVNRHSSWHTAPDKNSVHKGKAAHVALPCQGLRNPAHEALHDKPREQSAGCSWSPARTAGCRWERCAPFPPALLGSFMSTAWRQQCWAQPITTGAAALQTHGRRLSADRRDQHSALLRTISIPTHTLTLEHSFDFANYSSINISFPYRPDFKTYLHFLKYWKALMPNFPKCWITQGSKSRHDAL